MKRFLKLGIASVLIASVAIASFAFTTSHKAKTTLPRYYKYVGPASFVQSDLLTPSNWEEVSTFITVNHTHTIVAEIEIDGNESGLIYSSGPDAGLPKVDVSSTFQTDLIKAGGFAASPNNFIQEVTAPADYDILNNSVKL